MPVDTQVDFAGDATARTAQPLVGYGPLFSPRAFDKRGGIRDGTLTLYTFKAGRRTVLAVTK